jgi:glutamate dehydrogenase (NAD(P)+)
MSGINPFEVARQQIDACAKILKLSPSVTTMLKTPMRELHVSLPVKLDDGQ